MDKRKLKEHARNMAISFHQMAGEEEIKAIDLDDLDDLIDQLDEPEDCTEALLDLGQTLIRVQAERDKAEKELQELRTTKPEKPVVPDFVGEFYEEWKKDLTQGLFNLITSINFKSVGERDDRIAEWIKDPENDAVGMLNDMKNGYTVEKEKTYRVKLPDNESKSTTNILALRRTQDGRIVINQVSKTAFIENENSFLTEDEIKRNHGYLWAFREEVEE